MERLSDAMTLRSRYYPHEINLNRGRRLEKVFVNTHRDDTTTNLSEIDLMIACFTIEHFGGRRLQTISRLHHLRLQANTDKALVLLSTVSI